MGRGKDRFEQLLKLLPEGWEKKARELKAFQRAREIKSPKDLLKLILLYLTKGKSFRGTSAVQRLSGEAHMSDVAILKRMRKSAEWLKWLCGNIYRRAGLTVEKPKWLKKKNVAIVDGTEDVKCGVRRQCYMLHYSLDLFTLEAREFVITDMRTGEKLANFKSFGNDDIVMGDRIYGTLPGIAYLMGLGAGYALRIKSRGFRMYGDKKQEIGLLGSLSSLKEGEIADMPVKCLINGRYEAVRICALRKDQDSERAGLKRLTKENQRKQGGKEVSDLQRESNKYIILATSLGKEVSCEQVTELYRMRWQIEIAFKRLKSLFQYNDLPVGNGESVKAWFYGKLLLAALCETLVNTGRFSPREGTDDGAELPPPEQMSLWREQSIALVIIVAMLLDAMNCSELLDHLHRLSNVCKDSKRKRQPQLCFFSSA